MIHHRISEGTSVWETWLRLRQKPLCCTYVIVMFIGNFYWNNNKAHVHKLASLSPHSTSHCLQCLWGLRIMDDWRGERKSNGLCVCVCVCSCVCVWRGKHVGTVVKKSLLDCWSTVEGCLPVSTPPGLSDLRLCLFVCARVCVSVCVQ